MKIIINKVENKKDFMDECYGILASYKRLLKNPNMHISKRSTKLIIHIIIVLTYFIAVTYSSIVYKKYVFYICLGISIMALAIAIAKIIRYTKLLNIQSNSKTDSILDIDEEKIVLDNKTVGTKYSVSWIDIKQILVSERSIIFMKKIDKTKLNSIIMISKEYEKNIIEALEKYDKKGLLIYNK